MDGLPLTFRCPACGVAESGANTGALTRVRALGLCKGCRAGRTLRRHPELTDLFVRFWRDAGFPASSSWLEGALPRSVPEFAAPESGGAVAGVLAH
jgi:hypothetical protein